jgi:hypothetical protein
MLVGCLWAALLRLGVVWRWQGRVAWSPIVATIVSRTFVELWLAGLTRGVADRI